MLRSTVLINHKLVICVLARIRKKQRLHGTIVCFSFAYGVGVVSLATREEERALVLSFGAKNKML
jgi:hypothetical protein